MNNTELYNVLGVSRNATENEIKKAYHKCAQKYHPDKTQGDKEAEEKYKKCVHAYEILMNPEKRQMYDQFGTTDNTPNMGGFDPFDIFNNFSGGFPGGFMPGNFTKQKQNTDIIIHLPVSLKELYHGITKEVTYKKSTCCKKCKGVGSKKPPITCTKCNGNGQTIKMVRQGPVQFKTVVTCETCHGEKVCIKPEDKCKSCKGDKTSLKENKLSVNILSGMKWEQTLRFYNEGHEVPNNVSGNVIVMLVPNDNTDEGWTRIGNDLHYKLTINFIQCISGSNIIINHINGEQITMVYNGIIQPGSIKKLKDFGMPVEHNAERGDLYVTFDVFVEIEPMILEKILKMYPPINNVGLALEDTEGIQKDSYKNQQHYEDDFQQHATNCTQQ